MLERASGFFLSGDSRPYAGLDAIKRSNSVHLMLSSVKGEAERIGEGEVPTGQLASEN